MLENVEEYQDWGMVHRMPKNRRDREKCKLCKRVMDGRPCPNHKGVTFKRWCTQLRNLGYVVDFRRMRASHYGAPTSRIRLFVVARCDGKPIMWPAATHGKEGSGLLPYRTAAECIDWSIPCPSIFLTKKESKKLGVIRPLADNTMRRIARGVKKYVLDAEKPFIVNLTHHGSDRNESVDEPMRTITGAKRGEKALVVPTIPTENRHALVSAFLAKHYATVPTNAA